MTEPRQAKQAERKLIGKNPRLLTDKRLAAYLSKIRLHIGPSIANALFNHIQLLKQKTKQ